MHFRHVKVGTLMCKSDSKGASIITIRPVSRNKRTPKLTINHGPLPVEPTLRHVMPALQHNMIALQFRVEVVPGGGDEGVFALQILDDLLALCLFPVLMR